MIVFKEISLRRGVTLLLDQASLVINPGEKLGLIGRNGAGKSSIFALLRGLLHEDSGSLLRPADWRLASVAQEMPETSQSATDFVIEGDDLLVAARAEVAAAEASGDGERMAHAYTALHDAGAHDIESRVQALLLGLGFGIDALNRAVNSFSGGWRMRLQLARALICPSDLLLLDEPTNHLDLDALVWLEGWLNRYTGTLMVISHDREFLDAVTRVTVHIEGKRLNRYGGNYSSFEVLRAQTLALQESAYKKQQEKIAHLQKFIDRFKAKASKARQAQSRVKALERMEKIAPTLLDAEFSFAFKVPRSLPNPMLVIQDAALGYLPRPEDTDTRPKRILYPINANVSAGQRIGILGANGQGKSTLVKTIARALPLLGGTLTEGKGLSIGYFAQHELDLLVPESTPLEHMIRLAKDPTIQGEDSREQDLRNFLGSFNFTGDIVKQAVGTMSGGEKARLVLCMLVWQRPNLLVLDEPTNHLDLATREALALALNEFEGSLLLVSHDRALLRAVCDEFWLVSGGGVRPFDGDLEDYQQFLLNEAREALLRLKPSAPEKPRASEARRPKPKLKALLREQEKLTAEIEAREAEKQALEARLSVSGLEMSPQEMGVLGAQIERLSEVISGLEEAWLALGEALDAEA